MSKTEKFQKLLSHLQTVKQMNDARLAESTAQGGRAPEHHDLIVRHHLLSGIMGTALELDEA